LLFLPEASNSDPNDPVSDWDSSSTVGGRRECWETLEVKLASTGAPIEDTLELALLGKGGLAVSTEVEAVEAVVVGTCDLLMTISDTDDVMDGCISDMLVLEEVLGPAVVEAEAATAAMLEAASWL